MKWSDYRAWQRVEEEITETAKRLCAQGCIDRPPPEKNCIGCGAGRDKDWRRDALTLMRKNSEVKDHASS